MKAIVHEEYGPPEVLELRDLERPEIGDDEVLVRVRAASIHPGDWMLMNGRPYVAIRPVFGLRRPVKKQIPGYDLAGVVEAVGAEVIRFRPGDEVFGKAKRGSCAEYAAVPEDLLAPIPAGLSFEQAACIVISGTAALRGIRDTARVAPGERVLINGASGGIGTFAIQIAKSLGAEVTAVCSGHNADLVRSIGADHVIDYAEEDFTERTAQYDVVFDNVANHSLRRMRRAVAPGGRLISNNGTAGGRWFGSVGRILRATIGSVFIRKQGRPLVSVEKQQDLLDLKALIEAGHVTPVVDATYPLDATAAAMADVGDGHAAGKVVITI